MPFFIFDLGLNGRARDGDGDFGSFFFDGVDRDEMGIDPLFIFSNDDDDRIFDDYSSRTYQVDYYSFGRAAFRRFRRAFNIFLFLFDYFRGCAYGLFMAFFFNRTYRRHMAASYLEFANG